MQINRLFDVLGRHAIGQHSIVRSRPETKFIWRRVVVFYFDSYLHRFSLIESWECQQFANKDRIQRPYQNRKYYSDD